MTAVLIGLSLSGCAVSSNLKIPVEREVSYPVWLPAPGPSVQAKLPPRAETARQRGLAAAHNGNLPTAWLGFYEAMKSAHCSPSLMFNLGLTDERMGRPDGAVLWYRAYLSAVPDAANASDVRAETEKLVAETKANALRLWDEAERLADKLPSTPVTQGAKSLRQAALESIAGTQYNAGMTERADALARKAEALPGAVKGKDYWDKRGLTAATQSWDADRARKILERWGAEYPDENRRASGLSHLYTWRCDKTELRRLFDSNLSYTPYNPPSGIRSYEVLEIVHTRHIARSHEFDADWFSEVLVPHIELAFWDGRPDVALRLTHRARAYFEKYDIGNILPPYMPQYRMMLLALVGDREALETSIRRYFIDDDTGSRVALVLAATLTPEDAVTVIDSLVSKKEFPEGQGPKRMPLAYFARWVAAGQPDRALKVLDDIIIATTPKYRDPDPELDRSLPGYQLCKTSLEYALRFAVATGRTDLAFKLADRLSFDSQLKLVSMNRLVLAPGADAYVRKRVDAYAGEACGGWHPRDAAQAWEVWRRLRYAIIGYGALVRGSQSVYMEEAAITAGNKPETLPQDLAERALRYWIGAMAAREQF